MGTLKLVGGSFYVMSTLTFPWMAFWRKEVPLVVVAFACKAPEKSLIIDNLRKIE